MKRIVTVCLLLSMILYYFPIPVNAAEIIQNKDSVTVMDDTGFRMHFELVPNVDGTYNLLYYLNGVLDTIYQLDADSELIEATSANGSESYIVTRESVNTPYDNDIQQQAVSVEPLYSDLGQINYNYSRVYECSPYAILSYRITDHQTNAYHVNTYLESDYPDVVAAIVGIIIALNVPASTGVAGITALAVAILDAMLVNQGAEVVNQVISMFFIDTYDCDITTYSIVAGVIANGLTPTATRYDNGKKYKIYYSNLYSEIKYEGWTAENWAQDAFADKIWDDCVSVWNVCPGVYSYQSEVDHPWG